MKKIRLFLSGVVNSTNAQNLNCRALARYLDSTRFELRVLTMYSGNLPLPEVQSNVKFLHIRYPARIWYVIQLVRGIIWSDISYLPKPAYWKLQRFLIRLFRKKAFTTVEATFIGSNLEKALEAHGSLEDIRASLSYTRNVYSITKSMGDVNKRVLGLETNDKVLYLGVETALFENSVCRKRLTDVAIIGGNLFYKGLDEFFQLAKLFPLLKFHVIGSGMGKVSPGGEAGRLGLANVVCHGNLSHVQMANLLKDIQLHVFLSRAEGFPKVTLETAAAGVPSVVYSDYGASEWIETGKSGFVVSSFDEVKGVVEDLCMHPEKLQLLADSARVMAQRFDWRGIVKEWERVIDGLVS